MAVEIGAVHVSVYSESQTSRDPTNAWLLPSDHYMLLHGSEFPKKSTKAKCHSLHAQYKFPHKEKTASKYRIMNCQQIQNIWEPS
jgi:hypothetical protein